MKNDIMKPNKGGASQKSLIVSLMAFGFIFCASGAIAGESDAKIAISRAEAKIEMATRQAGLAGNTGDQSYNMARDRLVAARKALSDNQYDVAQNLADESALLAELTGEKAKLAALQTSGEALAKANAQYAPQ